MYILRADGNEKIGSGHLMRCLTVAGALAELNGNTGDILFLCADEGSVAQVKEYGFEAVSLGSDYTALEAELPKWQELLGDCGRIHSILADSYYVTDAYLQGLARYGRVMLLDDLQRKRYPVDGVVNYNAFAELSVYEGLYAGSHTGLYVGSSYVPLRPQFQECHYTVAKQVRDVLITTGGGDAWDIAGAIFDAIYDEELNYHLIIGAFNPFLNVWKERQKRCRGLHLHHNVKDMAKLMSGCDLAVTAGGTTIYELAAIGIPFICFSYAENQEQLTAYIGSHDVAGYAGAYHLDKENTLQQIKELFRLYCDSEEKRNACYEKERKLIDARGARRLAQALQSL